MHQVINHIICKDTKFTVNLKFAANPFARTNLIVTRA